MFKFFKKPISKKKLIIAAFVLIAVQYFIILSGPMFSRLAGEGFDSKLSWYFLIYGIAIFEMLTVPLTTLIICILFLEKFFKISPSKKKAFIYGFLAVFVISLVYFLSITFNAGTVHYSAFLTFIESSVITRAIYAFVNFVLSVWAYIPVFIYIVFIKILHVQGIGKDGMGLIGVCTTFISWPIWGGIFGMGVDWLFRKKVK
jgi:hypothetical protein